MQLVLYEIIKHHTFKAINYKNKVRSSRLKMPNSSKICLLYSFSLSSQLRILHPRKFKTKIGGLNYFSTVKFKWQLSVDGAVNSTWHGNFSTLSTRLRIKSDIVLKNAGTQPSLI